MDNLLDDLGDVNIGHASVCGSSGNMTLDSKKKSLSTKNLSLGLATTECRSSKAKSSEEEERITTV